MVSNRCAELSHRTNDCDYLRSCCHHGCPYSRFVSLTTFIWTTIMQFPTTKNRCDIKENVMTTIRRMPSVPPCPPANDRETLLKKLRKCVKKKYHANVLTPGRNAMHANGQPFKGPMHRHMDKDAYFTRLLYIETVKTEDQSDQFYVCHGNCQVPLCLTDVYI